jgi:glycosyltransferase involved in cell wall biosynthesis
MMSTLSVVIPAYNEEGSIAAIVERVLAVRGPLAAVGMDLELIVVDDGSSDRTAEITRCYDGVTLLCHRQNAGYGAALKTGFAQACGEWLGFLDADGTYPPEHFPQLCQMALEHEADLVVGSRRSGAECEMPLVRQVGNLLWSHLVTLVGNHRVADPASGMRVIRREALPRLYPLPDGLNFTPVMSTRAIHEDLKMIEVPIPYCERVGRSKLSVVGDGTRFLQSIVWTALMYNPVRVFGGLGVLAVLLALLVAATMLLFGVRGGAQAWPAFRLFVILVLVVGGINLFSVGTLFNYLVSLFHKRLIRQGLLGKPLFKKPLERNFIWMGMVAIILGGLFALAAIQEGLTLPPSPAYSFYLLTSGMLLLTGLQLILSWILVLVLAELSEREMRVRDDLKPAEV